MMRFKTTSGVTPLSNVFIEEYMPKAPSAMFSVIYIYGLKCAVLESDVDLDYIAKKLGVLKSDVVKAWRYWSSCGVVRFEENGEDGIVEFLPVACTAQQKETSAQPVTVEKPVKQQLKPTGTMPVYNSDDIKKFLGEIPELEQLIKSFEAVNSKPLGHTEVGTIIGFHTWLGLPFEVIAMLITYCSGKPIAYMEKTAFDWASKGINTAEEVEQYINTYHSSYRDILKCFGQGGRNPVEWELVYMNKWLNELKMPLILIKEACDRAMRKIGKTSDTTYKYADSIIQAWNNNNIRSKGELDAYDKAYREKKEAERAARKAEQATKPDNVQIKPTAFSNYEQRVYTDEELSEIMERKKKRMKR